MQRELQRSKATVELFFRELSLCDAEGAPHLVTVQRTDLPGEPGDGGHDEVAVGIYVKHMPHVTCWIADPMLGAQPGRVCQRARQGSLQAAPIFPLRRSG